MGPFCTADFDLEKLIFRNKQPVIRIKNKLEFPTKVFQRPLRKVVRVIFNSLSCGWNMTVWQFWQDLFNSCVGTKMSFAVRKKKLLKRVVNWYALQQNWKLQRDSSKTPASNLKICNFGQTLVRIESLINSQNLELMPLSAAEDITLVLQISQMLFHSVTLQLIFSWEFQKSYLLPLFVVNPP